jgi:hypothetical protein
MVYEARDVWTQINRLEHETSREGDTIEYTPRSFDGVRHARRQKIGAVCL